MIILIFIAINVTFLFFYMNKPSEVITDTPVVIPNKTEPEKTTNQPPENETLKLLTYQEKCVNSTKEYVKDIENITNITTIETKFFDKKNDITRYLETKWYSIVYDIKGLEKDVTEKTVVSVFDVRAKGERNFTLPILCDENGNMGNYSSCLLDNIPNIPSACYNFTINLTECEIEWRDHYVLEDIQFWVEPPGAALIIGPIGIENKTEQVFNFTIKSSRKMLESFGMNVIERTFSPLNDDVIFSSTKISSDGKGGSIVTEVNLTERRSVEFYATIWFKKKCYDKYVIY
ncbi:MAG: hypothetical protein ACFFDS_09860 [Candidatus Thorarchaeota archaeon]